MADWARRAGPSTPRSPAEAFTTSSHHPCPVPHAFPPCHTTLPGFLLSTEALWSPQPHRGISDFSHPCHSPTCPKVVAGLVHLALEELLPHDGIDDDHEEDEQCNVEQRHHGFDNGVQDNLKTCTREKGEGSQPHPKQLWVHPVFLPAPLKCPTPRELPTWTKISAAPFSTHAGTQNTPAEPFSRQW